MRYTFLVIQIALLVQWLILIGLAVTSGTFWLLAVGGAGCALGTVVLWWLLARSGRLVPPPR